MRLLMIWLRARAWLNIDDIASYASEERRGAMRVLITLQHIVATATDDDDAADERYYDGVERYMRVIIEFGYYC